MQALDTLDIQGTDANPIDIRFDSIGNGEVRISLVPVPGLGGSGRRYEITIGLSEAVELRRFFARVNRDADK